MKRLSVVLLVMMLGALGASAQSLAQAAQEAKAEKKAAPAAHVYTNDDIAAPAESMPAKPAADASAAKTDSDAKDADQPADKDKKDSKEDAKAKATALQSQIDSLKKYIAEQEHDLSITEREHQIKVAEYYADAGTQLRTSGKWFEDEKQYQTDLDAKKKAISDAKAKLDDLNEQARKAGVPTT